AVVQEVVRGCWIHAVDPTKEEMLQLEQLGIIVENMEDALDPDELPRLEHKDDISYFILPVPYVEEGRNHQAPILVAVAQDFFLTLSKNSFDWLKNYIFKNDTFTHMKTRNFIEIGFWITEQYLITIRKISKAAYAKRTNLANLTNDDIKNLVETEETLNKFDNSLVPLIGMLEKVMSGKIITVFQEDRESTEDLIIDARQALTMCETSIRSIVNIREAYTAVITNNLNKVIRFLSALTVLVALPTIVASIFGMNVALPMAQDPMAFWGLMVIMLVFMGAGVAYFYFRKWL
ncbi:MAG TPA: magnesium transporter CorA family protein, partial [Methanomassiliicoccales archaeon]|nr:magnesium transporter CorA family protein [Methanomassiliicoccales archaeon]